MNISYKWLKEYVDFSLSPAEVCAALTSTGLEVDSMEEVQAIRGGLKGLIVGETLTCEPHPDSDHMHVCTVNVGAGEPLQIVCGAPNVAAHQKVIVATIGTKLYGENDEEFTIKKSKLRGVESYGMICAEDEIGVGTSHDGIMVLPAETKVGTPAAEYFHLESDYLIEVDITPNRSDGCSHYGVARDLYAYLRRNGYATSLHRPSDEAFSVDSHDLDIDIVVEEKEACPRYCAVTLRNCQIGESPQWLKDKLTTIGCRAINNVVDITNYIMFAYGQPLHCFDADMIEGKKVVVRTMPEGTPFVTLDGEEHKLSDKDLAICNAHEPMCIAGVFGGKGSGTYPTTKNILLESAYFSPTWIRKSARRHGLSTDASFRFERGVDPDLQIYALKQAAILARELTGGEIAMEIKDVEQPGLVKSFLVDLDYDYAKSLIGKEIPSATIKDIVESLEMKILSESPKGLRLEVPGYRVDVQRPCDVVEDVLRIYGYNNVEIPSSVKSCLTLPTPVDRAHRLQNLVSEQLVGQGFREILNNSLTREAYYTDFSADAPQHLVRVVNPLSTDLNVLRSSLLFGGLETIVHNANRKSSNLRLFEFGKCYFYNEERRNAERPLAPYHEDDHLSLWLTGKRVSGSWAHADEESSAYEMKAYVVAILRRIGINPDTLKQRDGEAPEFAKSLALTDRQGNVYAEFGVVKRSLAKDIDGEVYFADFNWSRLMKKAGTGIVSFKEISKYPAVSRDLALLVDASLQFSRIEQVARSAEKKYLKTVTLFDVYEGKNLPEGKKSYAVNFTLQDDERTMNDKQTDAIMQKIIASLEKQLGAQLR